MTQQQNTIAISLMHPVCCGLDVHMMKILACLIIINIEGTLEKLDFASANITVGVGPCPNKGSNRSFLIQKSYY